MGAVVGHVALLAAVWLQVIGPVVLAGSALFEAETGGPGGGPDRDLGAVRRAACLTVGSSGWRWRD